jgi:glucoamylase
MPAIHLLVYQNIHNRNTNIKVIKADLDFVAGNWKNQMGCDLWEEVRGTHFYTRLVQYRALVDGAAFATGLGDLSGALMYAREAAMMVLDIANKV